MQQLLENHKTGATLAAVRYHVIRLKSRPDTAPLAADVAAARAGLVEKSDAADEAKEERVAASAVVVYCDHVLDTGVMALSREATTLVNGDTSEDRYVRLFPTTPSVAMKPVAGDPQERYVRSILNRLAEDDAYATLRGYLPKLAGALDTLNATVKLRSDLYVKEAMAASERNIALDNARRTYNLMYPRLQLLFPKDPALVETFFKDLRGSGATDAEVPDGKDGTAAVK